MKDWKPRYSSYFNSNQVNMFNLVGNLLKKHKLPKNIKPGLEENLLNEIRSCYKYQSEQLFKIIFSKSDVYNVVATQMTRDYNVDLMGEIFNEGISPRPELIACEAKNLSSTFPVTDVRNFFTALKTSRPRNIYNNILNKYGISRSEALRARKDINTGILFSTSIFSDEAIWTSEDVMSTEIHLIGPDELIKLFIKHMVGVIKKPDGELDVDYDFFRKIKSEFQGLGVMPGFDKKIMEKPFNIRIW